MLQKNRIRTLRALELQKLQHNTPMISLSDRGMATYPIPTCEEKQRCRKLYIRRWDSPLFIMEIRQHCPKCHLEETCPFFWWQHRRIGFFFCFCRFRSYFSTLLLRLLLRLQLRIGVLRSERYVQTHCSWMPLYYFDGAMSLQHNEGE